MDGYEKGDPPPTYNLNGVSPDMDGKGVTRIDTILANTAGNHLCQSVWYDYEAAKGYDHVAMCAHLDLLRFNDKIRTVDMPNTLKIPAQPGGVEGQKLRDKLNSRFDETWTSYSDDFEHAVDTRNLDGAHDIWCLAAETFLWRYCNADWEADLPKHKPTRGQQLPMVDRDIAVNLYDLHESAQTSYGATTDDIAGQLHDLRWKLQRWTTPPGHDVKANTTDQQISINMDTSEITGNARPVTDEEANIVRTVLRKLGSFSRLNDSGLGMLSGLGVGVKAESISNVIALSAQIVLDARDLCQNLRNRIAQQNRNDKAEATRQ